MKKREENDYVRLIHIREAAEKAIRFVDGKTRDSLDGDDVLVFALVHALTIIGEASNSITESFRAAHPQIPWAVMTGMRHRVVHAYFDLNLDMVGDTVTQNPPSLLKAITEVSPPYSEQE